MNTKEFLWEKITDIKHDLMKQRLAIEIGYRFANGLLLSGVVDAGLSGEHERLRKQKEEVDAKIHYTLEVMQELEDGTFTMKGL